MNEVQDLLRNGPTVNIKFKLKSRANKAPSGIPANVEFDPLSLGMLLFALFIAMLAAAVVANKLIG